MGGGVGLFILNNTEYRLRNDLNENFSFFKSLFIEVVNKNKKNTLFGIVYRPPNQNINGFLTEFNHLMHKINSKRKQNMQESKQWFPEVDKSILR